MSSIRVQGLSSEDQFRQIRGNLEFKLKTKLQSFGLAAHQQDLVATLTFPNSSAKDKALRLLKSHLHGDKALGGIQADDRFSGITTLFSPECQDDQVSADIVAVHGFRGHGLNTWACPEAVWFRDLLPTVFPTARMMCFGYESRILSNNVAGVRVIAHQLLDALSVNRSTRASRNRPIVFLAHSLGGIVVKEALIMASQDTSHCPPIHRHTRCVAFFGTPHKGSSTANWARLLARISLVTSTTAVGSLNLLKKDSDALFELESVFASMFGNRSDIKIVSLFEQEKTRIYKFRAKLIVPRQSAIMNLPNEITIAVNSCHREMCRFRSVHDSAFQSLMEHLKGVIGTCTRGLPENEAPGKRGTREKDFKIMVGGGDPLADRKELSKAKEQDPNHDDLKANAISRLQGSAGTSEAIVGQITFPRFIQFDSHFVGRGGLIGDIEAHLRLGHRNISGIMWPACAAIIGTPGMGKTTLAKRILQSTRKQYDYAFVISAATKSNMLQDFKSVFALLGLDKVKNVPHDTVPEGIPDIVLQYMFETGKRWLLIFDNADEADIVLPAWPYAQGRQVSIIITSRNQNIANDLQRNTESFSLEGLTKKEGKEFLCALLDSDAASVTERDRKLCKHLAVYFDCWPLVLRQLGAFMNQTQTSPQNMWDIVQRHRRSSNDREVYKWASNGDYHEGTLMNAWNHILSGLPAESARLLNIFSLLDPEKIPVSLFPKDSMSSFPDFGFLAHDFRYAKARKALLKFAIITMHRDEDTISIHRAVQSTRLKMISANERNEGFNVALSTLRSSFPQQDQGNHMYKAWNECGIYLTHVLAFDKSFREWAPTLNDYPAYINMICDCTWYMWEIGQYDEALGLLESIKHVCSQTMSLDSLEAARIYVNHGSILSTLNRYDEAGVLFKQALQIRERILPKNDPLLANSYMQVGNYHLSQGQVESAVQAHSRVVEIRERSRSDETPLGIMIISYFNLCRGLLLSGKLDEADACLEKAEELEPGLDEDGELLRYKHHRLYIQGNIKLAREDNTAALEIHKEAYEIRTKTSATKYVVAASLHKIGTIYDILGDRDAAIRSYKSAICTLESDPSTEPAKLKRVARTEIRIARLLMAHNLIPRPESTMDGGTEYLDGNCTDQPAMEWEKRAYRHYHEGIGCWPLASTTNACDGRRGLTTNTTLTHGRNLVKDMQPPKEWYEGIDFEGLVPVIDR